MTPTRMMDDHLYNLCLQLVQENKALWRISKHYKEDAGDCGDCGAFWEKMIKDKEEHVEELTALLKKHLAG